MEVIRATAEHARAVADYWNALPAWPEGAAGAGTYATIGGVGLAMGGTAVGITLAPFAVIGAGVGLVGYGCYWLGKQVGEASRAASDEPPPPHPASGGPIDSPPNRDPAT